MTTGNGAASNRPVWAQRMREQRQEKGWSLADAARAVQGLAPGQAASEASLRRNMKRWEAGTHKPDVFYRELIAAAYGSDAEAFFPRDQLTRRESGLLVRADMDTVEVVERLRASDASPKTLQALDLEAEQLSSDYSHVPADMLRATCLRWLAEIARLREGPLSLQQLRHVLSIGATVATILACVENDLGDGARSETARLLGRSLAVECGNTELLGWSYEISAWKQLTAGNFPAVITAARAGRELAPGTWAEVQLAAQAAKAWARLGDSRQLELALESARALQDRRPFPENLQSHLVVDPEKLPFYAMDARRAAGDDHQAMIYAEQVMRSSVDSNGFVDKPMRLTEAQITAAVAAARSGDLEGAVTWGSTALEGERVSIPSLLLTVGDLVRVLRERYAKEQQTTDFVDRVRTLHASAAAPDTAPDRRLSGNAGPRTTLRRLA